MKKQLRRILSLTLALALMAAFWPMALAEGTYTDIAGHWAKAAIEKWSGLGILKGHDGKFRPDDTVTRAELSAILNRMLKYPAPTRPIFLDLTGDEWYYNDMEALARQGFFLDSYHAKGDTKIGRGEAAYLIANAFGLDDAPADWKKFSDVGNFSVVEKGIHAMSYYSFIHGYPDGKFYQTRKITRAEVVTILDNMIDTLIDKPGVYDQPLGDNVLVSAAGVELKNQTLKYLFVAPGVGDGQVTVTGGDLSQSVRFVVGKEEKALSLPAQSGGRTVWTGLKTHRYELFAGGRGMWNDPYQIATLEQFMRLPEALLGEYYVLVADITLTGKWTPIKLLSPLDGQGHTIRGLDVEITFKGTQKGQGGLFSFTNDRGKISNLTVEGNVTVTGDNGKYVATISGMYAGSDLYVGGIAGESYADIYNCVSKVNVTAKDARLIYAGGIVGKAGGKLENCTATGNVSATALGAQVSQNNTYAGGIAGFLEKYSITNCVASGEVFASGAQNAYAGGIVGRVGTCILTDCTSSGKVSVEGLGNVEAGGIAGYVRECEVQNCSASGNVFGKSALLSEVGGLTGFTYGCVLQNCSASGSASSEGKGTALAGGVVAHALYGSTVTNCVGRGNVSAVSTSTEEQKNANAGGVFGELAGSTAKDCWASGHVTAKGGDYSGAGGIAGGVFDGGTAEGQARSTLTRCYATGNASASGANSQNNAGGATGQIHASDVSACWASGHVSASGSPFLYNVAGSFASGVYDTGTIKDCYAVGSVTTAEGASILGGFVGSMRGNITNCYATGKFSAAGVGGYVGQGLAGGILESNVSMRQCADLLNTGRAPMFVDAPDTNNPQMTTLTPAQLTQQKTYTDRGWEFQSVWALPSDGIYRLPILRGVGEELQKKLTMPAHLVG